MRNTIIPRTVVNQLLAHAQNSPENEICGLIGHIDGIPSHCYRIPNIAENTEVRYEMDAQAQINAMRGMRDNGEQLFAIYHSHPHSEAIPSATDIREANYPDALYLIISLDTKGVLVMRGFYLRDHSVEEVLLEIE